MGHLDGMIHCCFFWFIRVIIPWNSFYGRGLQKKRLVVCCFPTGLCLHLHWPVSGFLTHHRSLVAGSIRRNPKEEPNRWLKHPVLRWNQFVAMIDCRVVWSKYPIPIFKLCNRQVWFSAKLQDMVPLVSVFCGIIPDLDSAKQVSFVCLDFEARRIHHCGDYGYII